jgi:hypothetical protein
MEEKEKKGKEKKKEKRLSVCSIRVSRARK